ncbi:biofilm operon icaADBC HTH-type negative transcriptional regulator IcaR [Methanobrevibacter cuticularis]|uniref:Biofilm operon icaADBC HTH-type negative transcriptional regulator IcaR n=1 Tax=Methanobrevibacter cuticularis TaxID=47311 RepID=A0A166DBN5_9EURY|nr:TetR/AcrR family transcriptional regulator [Methanobrevibacter cuticularis]KZX15416.1 biofilm operon icaADBC HTH-type negative transcriptional regulator IcaR [Methanobrevibacter cuticularis]
MNKISTKEKIFNEALDLFSDKGYNEVSIREIAKKVGIKESSIYNHYLKKESILDSIFDYFMRKMNETSISQEHMEQLLTKSPRVLYNFGSEQVKYQFSNPVMIKILRLIFIELYHNQKISDFFLKELINGPILFWTMFFQSLMDKKIIRKSDPKKLAENYYNYAMFKIFETMVLKYPTNLNEKEIEKVFNDIEYHFNFILSAVSIDKNIHLKISNSSKDDISKTHCNINNRNIDYKEKKGME